MAIVGLAAARRAGLPAQGLTIAALAIGGVSLIGVITFQMAYSSTSNERRVANAEPAVTQSILPSANSTQSATSSPEAVVAVVDGSAEKPHPVGAAAIVGNEYQVQVLSVKLNATDEVVANNMFNKPPKGRYILVDLSVTYAGAKEGNPWIDLTPTFVGTDARQYDASSCGASLDNGAMNVPTLEKGGQANYQVCMDVPLGAIEGGKIFVQKRLSMNSKSRIYWGLN
ncbi:hypothetical protein ACETK3_20245 [Arthrobacter sp. E44]|uniref:hypothetical protein n=1 Tax=Arthrobacter sp. E44 TaxID=3341794 RepID=UPI0035A6D45E